MRAVRLDSGSEMEHSARLNLCPWGKRRVCISKCDLLLKVSVQVFLVLTKWSELSRWFNDLCHKAMNHNHRYIAFCLPQQARVWHYDSDEDLVVPCCWSLQEDFDNAAAADRRSYCLLTICLDSHRCCIELHCVYSEVLTPMKTHLAALLIWARTIWKRTLRLEFKNFGIKCGDTFAPLTIDSCLVNS